MPIIPLIWYGTYVRDNAIHCGIPYMQYVRTFGSDFSLVVWRFRNRSPNLMYANTNHSHVYYEYYIVRKSTLNIALFAKLKNFHQFALHSNSPNLIFAKCNMYTVYMTCFATSVICMYGMHQFFSIRQVYLKHRSLC